MKVKGVRIILLGRKQLVGGLIKVFEYVKGYCIVIGSLCC